MGATASSVAAGPGEAGARSKSGTGQLRVESLLADCKEPRRMLEVMQRYKPAVVFHAAAYKHVALMQENPVEAVRNNALGTRGLTEIAGDHGVDAFVLVSTDKAVAPATV